MTVLLALLQVLFLVRHGKNLRSSSGIARGNKNRHLSLGAVLHRHGSRPGSDREGERTFAPGILQPPEKPCKTHPIRDHILLLKTRSVKQAAWGRKRFAGKQILLKERSKRLHTVLIESSQKPRQS